MAASVDFPKTLPGPTQPSYKLQPVDPVARTNMDAGSTRSRRRFTTYPTQIPVQWQFTEAEFATFEAWFDLTVNSGESWFNINLLNGMGSTSYEAKFIGSNNRPWEAALQSGNLYQVTGLLQVKSRPIVDQTYLDVATTYDPNDITYGSPVLHTFVNTTLPSANYW